VGDRETGGFHRQHQLMRERWRAVLRGDLVCKGCNHFTILDELVRSSSPLFASALALTGLPAA
jgi:hypothetical protein